MRSNVLQQFKKGYVKFAAEQGYKQRSAMPWTEGEMQAVLHHLETQLTGLQGMGAALLARDAFLFAVLWQTKSRGCNAGMWRLKNLKLPVSMHPFLTTWCTAKAPNDMTATNDYWWRRSRRSALHLSGAKTAPWRCSLLDA